MNDWLMKEGDYWPRRLDALWLTADKSVQEIAQIMGISRSRAYQLINNGVHYMQYFKLRPALCGTDKWSD